jgi:uncharacterized protein (DUF2147 family)
MMKTLLLFLSCVTLILFSCSSPPEPEDITGLWKSRDQKSATPRSLVAIYKYQDMYYGRMLATYDEDGNIKDTILEKKERSTGVVGNPPYCGMDFVYNLEQMEDNGEGPIKYQGKIIDPQKGKVYKVVVWRDGDVLMVRGELWIFGKTIPWQKASKSDLPKGFSMRDIQKFVPVVPEAI